MNAVPTAADIVADPGSDQRTEANLAVAKHERSQARLTASVAGTVAAVDVSICIKNSAGQQAAV